MRSAGTLPTTRALQAQGARAGASQLPHECHVADAVVVAKPRIHHCCRHSEDIHCGRCCRPRIVPVVDSAVCKGHRPVAIFVVVYGRVGCRPSPRRNAIIFCTPRSRRDARRLQVRNDAKALAGGGEVPFKRSAQLALGPEPLVREPNGLAVPAQRLQAARAVPTRTTRGVPSGRGCLERAAQLVVRQHQLTHVKGVTVAAAAVPAAATSVQRR